MTVPYIVCPPSTPTTVFVVHFPLMSFSLSKESRGTATSSIKYVMVPIKKAVVFSVGLHSETSICQSFRHRGPTDCHITRKICALCKVLLAAQEPCLCSNLNSLLFTNHHLCFFLALLPLLNIST